jgi:hypothetical protein
MRDALVEFGRGWRRYDQRRSAKISDDLIALPQFD